MESHFSERESYIEWLENVAQLLNGATRSQREAIYKLFQLVPFVPSSIGDQIEEILTSSTVSSIHLLLFLLEGQRPSNQISILSPKSLSTNSSQMSVLSTEVWQSKGLSNEGWQSKGLSPRGSSVNNSFSRISQENRGKRQSPDRESLEKKQKQSYRYLSSERLLIPVIRKLVEKMEIFHDECYIPLLEIVGSDVYMTRDILFKLSKREHLPVKSIIAINNLIYRDIFIRKDQIEEGFEDIIMIYHFLELDEGRFLSKKVALSSEEYGSVEKQYYHGRNCRSICRAKLVGSCEDGKYCTFCHHIDHY